MSRQMNQVLQGLGSEVSSWTAAVRELRADFGSKASGILAQAFGVTQRTGERWIAYAEGRSSQKSDPTRRHPDRANALIQLMRNRRAAKRLRGARRIKAGRVRVLNKSPRKGVQGTLDPRPRNVGDRDIAGILATARDAAADLVADGEYARAASVLDDGLLEAYGVPEGVLEIESYIGTPEIEE